MADVLRVVSGVGLVPVNPEPVAEADEAVAHDGFVAVLAAALAGDEQAWTVLYRSVSSNVRSYAVAQGALDPDDLVGEVFLQVARNIARFHGTAANFRSWVFMIAHNRIVDARRAARRRPPPVELDEEVIDLRTMTTVDAEEAALDRLASERVNEHLASLTEDQRQVLLLRYLGDLTLEEVAAVTGRPLGAVKQLHRRGLRGVRRNLDKGVPG